MADDLPGFIEDDPKKAAKPKAPPPAPPAAAFNPFADVKVSLDPVAAPAKAPEPLAKAAPGKPAAKPAPGTGRVAKPPAAPVVDPGDADIAPGQGKDLWVCPHCSARNKPGRDTCRSCGRSPSDVVETPWHATPGARIGIAAGAVVLVAVIAFSLMGGDVKLTPGDAAHVDSKPRFGKRVDAAIDLGESRRFVAERRIAVCGRVLVAQPGPAGTTQVALMLGSEATDDAGFNALTIDTSGSDIIVRPEPRMALLDLLPGDAAVPKAARGDWLSILGASGVLEQEGQRSKDLHEGELLVRVDATSP